MCQVLAADGDCLVGYSTLLYSHLLYSTSIYSIILSSTLPASTLLASTLPSSTLPSSTLLYSRILSLVAQGFPQVQVVMQDWRMWMRRAQHVSVVPDI